MPDIMGSKGLASFEGGGLLIEGAYGLSETHTADTFMPVQRINGSMGIPGFSEEFRIVDLTDRNWEIPVGEPGEIVLKNPGVFKGYWNQEKAARNILPTLGTGKLSRRALKAAS